ncbi:unnamed protein product [Brassica oleracea]
MKQRRTEYQELANRVDEALGFMSACGLTTDHPLMTTTDFYTLFASALRTVSHEAGLDFWGIANPLGIKVSNKMDPNELVKLVEILNPNNKLGRITVIVRMGAENMRVNLCTEAHWIFTPYQWLQDGDPGARFCRL